MSLRCLAYRIATLALLMFALACITSEPAHCETATTTAPTRFTVTVEGNASGPAVLLLPGLSSSRQVFDTEAANLAPADHLYRVQIDGFAGQPAGANASGPFLAPVVEELHHYIVANHLHPAVIGHSLGGLLGLMLADAHPEDVQKLLIVDSLPFYALVFNPQATVATVTPQAQAMRDGMLKQTPEQASASAAQIAGYLAKDPTGVKLVAANSAASDRYVMATAMYEDMTTDLRPRLAAIKTPTTLLYPVDASLVGPDTSKIDALYTTAYSTMPNLTTHRIDDSRHFIMLDQPAGFHTAVVAFLAAKP